MTVVHIYRANGQPATRYSITLSMTSGDHTFWINNPRRRLMYCRTCKQRRRAENLVAHVYYDDVYFSCKPGKGCKQ